MLLYKEKMVNVSLTQLSAVNPSSSGRIKAQNVKGGIAASNVPI